MYAQGIAFERAIVIDSVTKQLTTCMSGLKSPACETIFSFVKKCAITYTSFIKAEA